VDCRDRPDRRAARNGFFQTARKIAVSARYSAVEIAKAILFASRPDHDRPWPSVRLGPKHLVPVANEPIIFHTLRGLRQAGLLEAMVVVEPDALAATAAAVGNGAAWGLTIEYASCRPHARLVDALGAAREFVKDEAVLVKPVDALHSEHIHPHIVTFARERLDALALRLPNAPLDADNKPVAGGYLFSERALAMLLSEPDAVADPIVEVLREGGEVREQMVDGCLACHGGQDRLLEGNRRILEQVHGNVDSRSFPKCEFQGPVYVHPTATLEHTLVRGPATVGPGAVLSHAYVGPYTSVGANVVIEGSEIEHSIVFNDARLLHVGTRLDSSVIGHGARIHRRFESARAMRLSVGPGAEITLS
jgi:glucose-1-phosphate thymidylyltransferase